MRWLFFILWIYSLGVAAEARIGLGSCFNQEKNHSIFEKHFFLGKQHKCVDAPVSIDSIQMRELKEELNNIDKIFGKIRYGIRKGEAFASKFRRKKEY